jgi:hypothetical protein
MNYDSEREYVIMQQQIIYQDTISASLKNRTFGNIIHYCTMTNPLLILEDDPVPIIDEEKKLSDDKVVE